MNLLFSINRTFIPLLLNCANSVLKNGGIDEYTVYVLHSDLEAEDMDAIQSALGKRMKFHFISVPVSLFEGFPTSRRYPQQIYYRLAAPLLLPPELERILYLDVDTIIINTLTELSNMPFDGTYFMACTHVRKTMAKINQARLGMEQETPYINSGVMLLNLPLFREHLNLAEIRAFANKKKSILFLPDQDILTALYGDHVKNCWTACGTISATGYRHSITQNLNGKIWMLNGYEKTVSSSITAERQSLGKSITTVPSAYFIKNWLHSKENQKCPYPRKRCLIFNLLCNHG